MYRFYKGCIDVDVSSAAYLRGCLYDLDGDGSEVELAQRLEEVECQLERRGGNWMAAVELDPSEYAVLVAALELRKERERSRDAVSPQGNR